MVDHLDHRRRQPKTASHSLTTALLLAFLVLGRWSPHGPPSNTLDQRSARCPAHRHSPHRLYRPHIPPTAYTRTDAAADEQVTSK